MSGRNTVTTIGMLSLLLLTGALAHADKLIPQFFLTVFDGKGNRVGNVISLQSPGAVVAFKMGKHSFALRVFRSGFSGTAGSVLFESPDCSGTPFLGFSADEGEVLPAVAVARPGNTLYVADPASFPRTITVQSRIPDLPGSSCTREDPTVAIEAIPAVPLLDLDTRFTPPFSVR